MTYTPRCIASKRHGLPLGSVCTSLLSLFCLLLLLKNANAAIEYVTRGLQIAIGTVIPALFPFMVLSELIVSGALGNICILLHPFCRALRLSPSGGCGYLLGLLCGAPVGARCLVGAYQRGDLDKNECEYLIGGATVPSSAFLVSAVGTVLWENPRFGAALFVITLLSSLFPIFFIFRKRKKGAFRPQNCLETPKESKASLFADAIRACAETLLTVTAYIVFFSVITGTVELVLSPLSPPQSLQALLSSILELSDGMSRISAMPHTKPAAILSAFAAGWGGLSVHCQVLSVCDGSGLSLRPYFLIKLCMSLLSAILMALLLALVPSLIG